MQDGVLGNILEVAINVLDLGSRGRSRGDQKMLFLIQISPSRWFDPFFEEIAET